MRIFRTVLAGLLAAVLVVAALSVGAANAAAPKRIIDERPPGDKQVSYNAFLLRGKVYEPQADGSMVPYANKTVKLFKKKCGTCKWKFNKKLKTNANGGFKTRIYAPQKGRWKWRTKVGRSGGYAPTKGKVWTLFFG